MIVSSSSSSFQDTSTDKLGAHGRIPFQPFFRVPSRDSAFAIASDWTSEKNSLTYGANS